MTGFMFHIQSYFACMELLLLLLLVVVVVVLVVGGYVSALLAGWSLHPEISSDTHFC
jgi:hypothetical protein